MKPRPVWYSKVLLHHSKPESCDGGDNVSSDMLFSGGCEVGCDMIDGCGRLRILAGYSQINELGVALYTRFSLRTALYSNLVLNNFSSCLFYLVKIFHIFQIHFPNPILLALSFSPGILPCQNN